MPRTKDLVLIHPPSTYAGGATPFYLMPVGLFSMASKALAEGFDVEIVNIPLEAELTGCHPTRILKRLEARVYAISLHWFVHADGALETARMLKVLKPSSKVVIGGMTATVFCEEIRRCGYVDAVILGEGENALLNYLKYALKGAEPVNWNGIYAKIGKKWVKGGLTPPPELSGIDIEGGLHAVRHLREYLKVGVAGLPPRQLPHFWVPVARGCIFDCIYCGGSREGYFTVTGRSELTPRDPVAVADEIEVLAEKGVRIVRFTHDLQILGERWWKTFLKEIRERGLDLKAYWESFRIPFKPLLEEAERTFAMLDVAVSPETATEKVRFRARRFFTNEAFLKSLNLFEGKRAVAEIFFLVGLPGETQETAMLIPRFAREIVSRRKHVLVYPTIPYTIDPNSPMALHPESYGVKLHFKRLSDYARAARGRETVDFIGHSTRELSRKAIARLTDEIRESLMVLPQEDAVQLKVRFEEEDC